MKLALPVEVFQIRSRAKLPKMKASRYFDVRVESLEDWEDRFDSVANARIILD